MASAKAKDSSWSLPSSFCMITANIWFLTSIYATRVCQLHADQVSAHRFCICISSGLVHQGSVSKIQDHSNFIRCIACITQWLSISTCSSTTLLLPGWTSPALAAVGTEAYQQHQGGQYAAMHGKKSVYLVQKHPSPHSAAQKSRKVLQHLGIQPVLV